MQRSPMRTAALALFAVLSVGWAGVTVWRTLQDDDAGPRPVRERFTGVWSRSDASIVEVPGQQASSWDRAGDVCTIAVANDRLTLTLTDGSTLDCPILAAEGGTVKVRVGVVAGRPIPVTICQLGEGGPLAIINGTQRILFRPTANAKVDP
jgi:hypothetical protein